MNRNNYIYGIFEAILKKLDELVEQTPIFDKLSE